jgi:TolB protein
LTDDASRDVFPRWSPDGSSIAFASDRDGDLDLYLMAPDGSDIRQLTSDQGDEWLPAWAPDGRRVAYVSGRDGQHIRVIDADGHHDRG